MNTMIDAALAFLATSSTGELGSTIITVLRRDGAIGKDVELRHLRAAMAGDPRFVRHGRHLWRLAGRTYARGARG